MQFNCFSYLSSGQACNLLEPLYWYANVSIENSLPKVEPGSSGLLLDRDCDVTGLDIWVTQLNESKDIRWRLHAILQSKAEGRASQSLFEDKEWKSLKRNNPSFFSFDFESYAKSGDVVIVLLEMEKSKKKKNLQVKTQGQLRIQ